MWGGVGGTQNTEMCCVDWSTEVLGVYGRHTVAECSEAAVARKPLTRNVQVKCALYKFSSGQEALFCSLLMCVVLHAMLKIAAVEIVRAVGCSAVQGDSLVAPCLLQ